MQQQVIDSKLEVALEAAGLSDQYFKLILQSQSQYQAKLDIDAYVLNIVEYVAIENNQSNEQETSAETGTEDEELDEFKWIENV